MSVEAGVLDRIKRKFQAMVGRGRINVSNDTGPVQFVQATLGPLEVRDATPRVAEFGFSSRPPPGTDVVLVFVGGDRSNGIVIATGHQASRPTGLEEGETIVYDLFGKYIKFTKAGGIVVEANGSAVTINDATTVTINASTKVQMNTPLLQVSGNIVAGGDVSDSKRSMAADRVIYNGHTNGSGTSTPPQQQ
jgi:phage baseplate assembly protein V